MRLLQVFALCLAAATAPADDDWPEDDPPWNPHQVGAGELRFLPDADASRWLHVDNQLQVSAHSLQDGWVALEQCYTRLDAVAAVEVVYRYREMRGLRVLAAQGIAAATAGERSVSLADVQRGARLCVAAEVRILEKTGAGGYRLSNGPFHHRFLDGYFPMRVTFTLDYPAELLQLARVEPQAQPGIDIRTDAGQVAIDARFTGMLTLALELRARKFQ